MSNDELTKWISDQEKNHMFRHSGSSSEALKLLEKTKTNRDINGSKQGQLLIIARFISNTGFEFYNDLADSVELTQMNIDNQARKDYMKTVIEQWQGKIRSNMEKNMGALK